MSELDLRRDALACFEAAVRAVEPERLTQDFLQGRTPRGAGNGRIVAIAVGKAAVAMARGAFCALGSRLEEGIVIAPPGTGEASPPFDRYRGGHPIPNEKGVQGARAVLRLAESLGSGDELLCLVSGGGSALMTLPPEGVSLAEIQSVSVRLMRAGAGITELNAVRKHLDRLKGGRLARAAAPARVTAAILSDVVGDPLDVIASGPVSPDPTTFQDAIATLRRHGLWSDLAPTVRRHLEAGLRQEVDESPSPSDPCFERVEARVIGNNELAAGAALAEASRRGYRARLLTTTLVGEAREAGGFLAAIGREVRRSGRPVEAPACLVAAGETTVTVRGQGRGGRNQEVALGAALGLDDVEGVLVAALGTDGIDGPTDAAGAVADGTTLRRARAAGLDPAKHLADNDAYPFFQALDDLLVTGPTGTNVMDLALVMVDG